MRRYEYIEAEIMSQNTRRDIHVSDTRLNLMKFCKEDSPEKVSKMQLRKL
jgi:hypothetical protein